MSQIKLDHLTVAKVSGEDAGDYLQAQLTADLTGLTDGQACFSAYCRPSGNVLAVILVLRHKKDFYLVASRDLMGALLDELGRFILRARVSINESNKSAVGVIAGDKPESPLFASPKGTSLTYGLVTMRVPSPERTRVAKRRTA